MRRDEVFELMTRLLAVLRNASNDSTQGDLIDEIFVDLLFSRYYERVGIAHCTREGALVKVNARFVEIMERPVEELLRMTVQDITHPEDGQCNEPSPQRAWQPVDKSGNGGR